MINTKSQCDDRYKDHLDGQLTSTQPAQVLLLVLSGWLLVASWLGGLVAWCRQAALSATVARCRWATVPLLPPPTLLGLLLKYLEFSYVFPINVLYVYTGLAFSQPRCGRLVVVMQFFIFFKILPSGENLFLWGENSPPVHSPLSQVQQVFNNQHPKSNI